MPKLKKAGQPFVAMVAAVLAMFTLASVGCKDSTSPVNPLASIVIVNNCGATVDAYLDGTVKATIETSTQATISDVAAGSRLLEVKKADDGLSIISQTLTVSASSTHVVTIRGGASVRVTNQYGEILSIYDDQAYIGDIGDQITQTISNVTFGTHVYRAKKKSDGTVVAEITINVTDFAQHVWTITP